VSAVKDILEKSWAHGEAPATRGKLFSGDGSNALQAVFS